MKFQEYLILKKKMKEVSKDLKLNLTELEALLFMGENNFDKPLKRHTSLRDVCVEYSPERSVSYVPAQIGADSLKSLIPNFVRKKIVSRLSYIEDIRKICIELTPKGKNLYKQANEMLGLD